MKVSDRYRNVNNVKIIGCVLMKFQYEQVVMLLNFFYGSCVTLILILLLAVM